MPDLEAEGTWKVKKGGVQAENSFDKHSLNPCSVSGAVLGAGNTSVNKTKISAHVELSSWQGEQDKTQEANK